MAWSVSLAALNNACMGVFGQPATLTITGHGSYPLTAELVTGYEAQQMVGIDADVLEAVAVAKAKTLDLSAIAATSRPAAPGDGLTIAGRTFVVVRAKPGDDAMTVLQLRETA